MIYRYTIGSIGCVLASLALFWCSRSPKPVSVAPAPVPAAAPARTATPSRSEARPGPLIASPVVKVKSLRVDALAAEFQGVSTNECGGECERTLRDLAGRLDLIDLPAALAAGDSNLSSEPRR